MTGVGRPVDGDTVLVTAAARATGSMAGQIARIKGAAQVIGTAGSEAKRTWSAASLASTTASTTTPTTFVRQIRAANRDGYQVVFDNVGGSLLDVSNYADRFDEARRDLMPWAAEGRRHQRYDVMEGVERAPMARNLLSRRQPRQAAGAAVAGGDHVNRDCANPSQNRDGSSPEPEREGFAASPGAPRTPKVTRPPSQRLSTVQQEDARGA